MRISDWSSDVCSSDLPQQLATFMAAVTYAADGRNPWSTPKFLLQAALETGQESNLADAARALTERCWTNLGLEELSRWNPIVRTPSLGGVRSEERRVGKEGVGACRAGGA